MVEFIERNGGSFRHPPGGLMATAEMIERLAAQSIGEADFRVWVAERTSGQ